MMSRIMVMGSATLGGNLELLFRIFDFIIKIVFAPLYSKGFGRAEGYGHRRVFPGNLL